MSTRDQDPVPTAPGAVPATAGQAPAGARTDVAYVTFADGEAWDADMPVALDALRRRGLTVEAVAWDDPGVDWASYGVAVVRSTWDYVTRRDDFVAWAHAVEGVTLLCNPAAVVEANTDKTYLRALADAGVPVVPTRWVAPGEDVRPGPLPWPDVVVKPAVSAGARDTLRTTDAEEAAAHLADVQASGRVAMVQPYLAGIDAAGETSLLHVGGRYSHTVRRDPALGASDPRTASEATEPTDAQRAVAEAALAAVPGHEDLLYARVDVVPGPDGGPVVLELELAEPRLFLTHDPAAPGRLADAVAARLSGRTGSRSA